MYLKELSIQGFKSFAKKSELEFSSSITAIVGPNGSGKSNIAESFRFVLGEQSVKSMRGKKGEDLIWGGSDKISRGNRAGVQVTFDNTKRNFGIDFNEVKIERIVHRDGQNEYKINDSTVRLKDVHELLAGANIGSSGHHIISQGEADRVLAAGPKERREMIEDALGLKVYQLKKQETQRKLEKTQENILQVESLRREAAPHLKYLKKQVEKAERSLQVQAQLKQAYAEYLKREDTYLAFHSDRLQAEKRAPETELLAVQKRLSELKELLKETDDEQNQTQQLQTLHSALKEHSHLRQSAEREVSSIEGQMSFLQRRLDAPAPEAAVGEVVVRAELEKLVTEIENGAHKALSKGGESVLKRALNDLVNQLKSFIKKEPVKTIDTTQADQEEFALLKKKLHTAQAAVADALEKEESARVQVSQQETQKQQGTQQNREAEREMFTLINTQRETEQTLHRLSSELSVLERDRNDFKQELQEAVSLLGRGASDYYTHELRLETGEVIAQEDIVHEDRQKQAKRRTELEKLKIRLEELGVGATDDLLKEYKEAQERDEFLAGELEDLSQSVQNLLSLTEEMQEKLQEQFAVGMEKISQEFNTFFTLMFGGGSAVLQRVALKVRKSDEDTEEEESQKGEEGVELNVQLPNKRVKGLEMLSGGERALTSIALIFAMSQVNPPPFIILDETDAALDEANSRRYGDMIEALAKKSQLVLITHNRETMSRAGILYGITMGGDGVSKVLSVKFEEAAAVAK
jgi:chromosome segregation protein